ncbi:MAG: MerC domain-containing protein [Chitinophagaceae bacterium]|nr:MerC domain-containing protein [Chitinophagaceae bacterium]
MKRRINWDALGIGASLACAIHCAVLPLFLNTLPLFGINILHNVFFETAMIVLALAIGIVSLWHGYRRHHHRLIPFLFLVSGFIFLFLKQFFSESWAWLLWPAVFLIVLAHYLNFRFCRLHNHAHEDDCRH